MNEEGREENIGDYEFESIALNRHAFEQELIVSVVEEEL